MFEPSHHPRVFGVAPGEDFPRAVVDGVMARMKGKAPECLARVRILVNTRRMQRRLRSLFVEQGPMLLPRIGLVTEMDALVPAVRLPAMSTKARRRLELAELVAALIDADPSIAPRAALFDLTDSLATLLDEMQGESVDPETVSALETGDQSGHWARSQAFLGLVTEYLARAGGETLDAEARQRAALSAVSELWQSTPPHDPVLIAGSTGSRGTTAALMKAVSSLPQGALILPGYDDTLPHAIWSNLQKHPDQEDHPQYRFAALLQSLELSPSEVENWHGSAPSISRNRLISLSLRPAPVTHQWLEIGPSLGDLRESTNDLTLLEAPNQRQEAVAIAVAMRLAVEGGQSVALVTPDRTLGRRVASALNRWGIVPDDSAGRPLAQTAPGRLLRMVARLPEESILSEDMIALLRHPLTHSNGQDRGRHLLLTQEFELFLRKNTVSAIGKTHLATFGEMDAERHEWVRWVEALLTASRVPSQPNVQATLQLIVEWSEKLAAGPGKSDAGALWDKAAGRDTKALIDSLMEDGDVGPEVTRDEVTRLLDRALNAENTRNSDDSRPDVMIWGTLEARVQGADLVILGGLNEGVWPARPAPDPWLNRRMRKAAGLLLPERQIGLSAHDYQQAVAAKKVVMSRSLKDDDAETVASRWVNRLTNLVSGLPDQYGIEALDQMRARGRRLLVVAQSLDHPSDIPGKTLRPSPAPPVHLRPKVLSVTEIETLIRDPYAVYARRVLGLRSLNPLRPQADAALRGTVFHAVLDNLLRKAPFSDRQALIDEFLALAKHVLDRDVPWPSTRALWYGHLEKIAPRFADMEMARQSEGSTIALEVWGEFILPGVGLGVRGKADRIDRLSDGRIAVFDYKSGAPPTLSVIKHFKRQLPIEAVMAEAGAFEDVPGSEVAFVSHIGLNKDTKSDRHDLVVTDGIDLRTVTITGELTSLLTRFMSADKGYPARRAMEKVRWDGDYDHLARFGEWDDTEPAEVIKLP